MTAPAARPPARAELLCVRAVFTRPGDALVGTPAPYRRTRPPPCP